MKKMLFGLFFITITNFSIAQNCKYEKNEVDKFTNASIKTTKELFVAGGSTKLDGTLYASLSKINKNRFLNIKLTTWDNFVIETDGKFLVLFDDNSVMELSFIKYAVGEYDNNSGLETWTANAVLHLTDNDYEELKLKEVKETRVYLKEGYLNLPVPNKFWKKFKQNLKCIE
ncbi:hypothetical protein [Mariniflexile sp. HMF6888]|uniref:hypothetical protein n=1 Tax=Mariniflexile sp. HMF6888 TaxID=3373086 RepID=UPI0037AF8713